MIYANDHRPAHVPVVADGWEAVFVMNCIRGPIPLRENYGVSLVRLRRIESFFEKDKLAICVAGKRIHGGL